jgi:hypothetical protein
LKAGTRKRSAGPATVPTNLCELGLLDQNRLGSDGRVLAFLDALLTLASGWKREGDITYSGR